MSRCQKKKALGVQTAATLLGNAVTTAVGFVIELGTLVAGLNAFNLRDGS